MKDPTSSVYPPSPRNTISVQKKVVPPPNYDVPRPRNPKGIDSNIYLDPASESDEEDDSYYRVPRPNVLRSKDGSPMVNGASGSPPREGREKSTSPLASKPEESLYEIDPPDARGPIYENAEEALAEERPYENHSVTHSPPPLPPSPPTQKKLSAPLLPPRSTPTHVGTKPSTPRVPLPQTAGQNIYSLDDYVDVDEHDEYVDPDLLSSNPSSALQLPRKFVLYYSLIEIRIIQLVGAV